MSTAMTGLESQLAHQLSELGIQRGGTLMVHAALSAVGRVNGGPATVLRALRGVLGPEGTVVVPTFTSDNSDSSSAHLERVRGLSEEARAAVRESMPPFDPASSRSTGMGILAETVRQHPDSLRSTHPQTSFAALGPKAEHVIADHRPDCHLGEHSPLARLYEMGAEILLMGVGFDTCTAFHLGEYRISSPPRRTYRCVIRVNGRRQWWTYDDVALDDSDFGALGEHFERAEIPGAVRSSSVGAATCKLVQFVDAVDYAKKWFSGHRSIA